jgi:uncharacterized protein involved in outer membrane biogenesis
MKKLLIIGGIVVAAVVVGVLVMVGKINPIVKGGVEKAGPVILKAPVSLDSVNISFFSGSGEFKGFTVGNPEGYKTAHAFSMDRLKIDLDVKSVTSDKVHKKNIILDSPNIIYEGSLGKSNLSQLQANASGFTAAGDSGDKKEGSSGGGKKMIIDQILIDNGSISVSMGILQGQKLTVPLPRIELNDIGKESDATIADVMGEILAAINNAALPAVQSGVGGLGIDVEKTGKALQEKTGQGLDKIKGLFGK